ncbi:MAG TPA: hypothetical protein DIW45_04665 [Erythrobacter sp.]|nr:hypothetical protein [Erythrobacter sp.]
MSDKWNGSAALRYRQQAIIELDLQTHLLRRMEPGTWPADSEMGRRWKLIEDSKARGNAFQEMARLEDSKHG